MNEISGLDNDLWVFLKGLLIFMHQNAQIVSVERNDLAGSLRFRDREKNVMAEPRKTGSDLRAHLEQETDREALRARELEQHVLYAMLRPAVRLATRLAVPLRELGQWAELGYFHELRRQNFKMREISESLEISMRKAALLSKQLKDSFFEPEQHGLARRIEFMIWAESMSLARLQQHMPEVDEAEIREALDQLLEEGRLLEVPGRVVTYEVARGESRLVRGNLMAKLDALNKLLDTVSAAIEGRFFDDEPAALARNLELRVRREDVHRLRELYEEVIFAELSKLDAQARDNLEESVAIDFTVCWAPRKQNSE